MSELKFKIGDKVKVNNPLFSNHEYKNLVGVIDEIILNDVTEEKRYHLSGFRPSFVHSELELIATIKYEITDFKPGDKVKVISETSSRQDLQHLGKTYTIKEQVAKRTLTSVARYIVEETNCVFF